MTAAAYRDTFDYGRVIARAFESARRNLTLLATLALLLYGLPKLGATLLDISGDDIPVFGFIFSATGGLYDLVATLGYFALQAAVVYVFAKDLDGQTPRLGGALRAGANGFFPVLGLFFVTLIAVILGGIAFVVPGLMIATAWFVAAPAAVVERISIREAIDRSIWLTRYYRWPVFGFIAVLVLAAIVIGSAIGDDDRVARGLFDTISLAVRGVTGDIFATVGSLACVLLVSSIYYELRVLKEGASPAELAELLD